MSETAPRGHQNEQPDAWNTPERQMAEVTELYTYTHAAADFRSAVNHLFGKYVNIDQEILVSWLYWAVPPKSVPGEKPKYNSSCREILMLLIHEKLQADPTIRILTNEQFDSDKGVNILTEDFILDARTDAQQYVDVAVMEDDDQHDTMSPLFQIFEGEATITNFKAFTPMTYFQEPNSASGEIETVAPFGDSNELADKIDALNWGKALFSEVEELEPDFGGYNIKIIMSE